MEKYVTIKVKPDVKRALKIKSAKEDLTMRALVDRIMRAKLIEEGDLSNG